MLEKRSLQQFLCVYLFSFVVFTSNNNQQNKGFEEGRIGYKSKMSTTITYAESFLTKKPKDSIHIVRERLNNAVALNSELADYFKERAQIEDAYAKSLSNASKKLYTKDLRVLGHFAPVWECLLKEFNQIATYHSDMAYKIIEEVEKPLRRSTSSEDQQRLQQLESTILANDSKKTVKGTLFKKSKSSSSLWQNEGAEYLNLQQKLDESRLNRMKSVVERFENIQTEQLMKRVKMSNATLNNAEAFDVQHDISDFCAERRKGLSSSTSTMDTSSTHSKSSKRLSTASSSFDSHRSTNKFKSVFMKKKKNLDKLPDRDDHSSSYTEYSAVVEDDPQTPPDATLPISPPATSPSTVDHFSTTTNTTNNNNTVSTIATGNNSAPLVDSDGYAIPATTNNAAVMSSDVSSRNTFDDVDSFQSAKFNQRIQINIKEDAVQEDTSKVNESYNKMANMLRERTPTLNRRARGRRDTITRSQTDTSLFNATSSAGNGSPRVVSMIAVPSSSENSTNPFLKGPSFNTIYAIPESAATRSSSMTNLNQNIFEPPSSMQASHSASSSSSDKATPWQQLQAIPEVTNQSPASVASSPSIHQQQFLAPPQPSYLNVSISETTHMNNAGPLHVSGRIMLSYYASTLPSPASSTVVPLRLEHVSGVCQLEPNANYITVEDGEYKLHTDKMEGNGEPIVGFSFEMDLSSSALPIRLSPSWKCVEGTSYLIIKHQRSNMPADPADLTGKVFVDMSRDRVSQVQSTPQGVWDMHNHRLTWQLSDLMSQYSEDTEGETQQQQRPRLLAKFYLEGQSSPAPIYLKYCVKGASISGIQVVSDGLNVKQTERSIQSREVVYHYTKQQ